MQKFRKKPIEIEAVLWDGTRETGDALRTWSDHQIRYNDGSKVFVDTLEGTMEAATGDWIIRGVKGEFYPCKPGIFLASYDPVD